MQVTIIKMDGGYYSMRVDGSRLPDLAPRRGPGHGAVVPHDVAHLLVEIELGLAGGVFGRVARSKSTWFSLLDPSDQTRHVRRMKKWNPSPRDRSEMAKSEEMASIGEVLARQRITGERKVPTWFSRLPDGVEQDPDVRRVVERFVEFAERWRGLSPGESTVVDWPDAPTP